MEIIFLLKAVLSNTSILYNTLLIAGAIWPFLVINDLTYLAQSSAFTTWYKAEDKNLLSSSEITENVVSVIR